MKLSRLILLIILTGFLGSAHASAGNKSVYIDPFFGGKEDGPIIGDQHKAKDIVLEWSKRLYASLEAKEITVYLSRNENNAVPVDKKLAQAKKNATDAYIALKISRQKNNCVNLLILKTDQSRYARKDTNINSIIEDLKFDSKIADSEQIAHVIKEKLNSLMPSLCVKVKAESFALLKKSHCPIVVIDFGISNLQSSTSYILDSILMDKIINAVSDGIKEHFTASQPNR